MGTRGAVGLVAEITWLDFVRRKDLYVVIMLMTIFVLGAAVVRIVGIDQEATARFLMSAGLALAHYLAACLAVSFCGRAFPEEMERGTLMPLLAKPISRAQVLAGKILACGGTSVGAYWLFVVLTIVAVPTVAGQRWAALAQAVVLQSVGIAFLGMLTMALSLDLPAVVAALAALLWYFGAGLAIEILGPSMSAKWPAAAAPLTRLWGALPDAGLLSHSECFAESSMQLGWGLFAVLLVYGLTWTAVLGTWARLRLERIRL
jgi:hypothetical protein